MSADVERIPPSAATVLADIAEIAKQLVTPVTLTMPISIHIREDWRSVELRLPEDCRDALDIWAVKLGLPIGTRQADFIDDAYEKQPWFKYATEGMVYWDCWSVRLWCSVEMPASEAAALRAARDAVPGSTEVTDLFAEDVAAVPA